MTTNTLPHVPQVDPLPPYSSNDPETCSVRSAAPSYRSLAPSYRTAIDRTQQRPFPSIEAPVENTIPRGLPSPTFAPGFRCRNGKFGSMENMYNVSSWSNATMSNPQARQYRNVAHRRVARATFQEDTTKIPATALSGSLSPLVNASTTTDPTHLNQKTEEEPLSPHEDPDLVGEVAAARAKSQRLYMQNWNQEEMLRQEGHTWDFFLTQMADWEERDKSWKKFRSEVERGGMLGRRIGLGRPGRKRR
ncbi:MAG: hypothetical protein M1834_003862 [Cirrosporium novae-zelandiae]|nr:MAG: hypothetical protein M1834_003862 [Cirrosporium novae-zelandiae]